MSENSQIPSLADDDLPDDIPLGNSDPLLVPTPLGQPFLQPKFIYPLGAVSIINPDSLNAESDFETLSDSFNVFDHPLQTTESVAPPIANSQPNLQAKTITSSPKSVKRSPQNTSSKNPATSSPLIIPSKSSSLPTSQTKIQTSIANSSPANNSLNLQSNSSDEQSSLSEVLDKSDISSNFSEDTPIQRFTDILSSADDATSVISDSTSSVANIESSISQEVENNQSSPQLIQRESDTFDSDSSDAIFADNSPAITSSQESEPNTGDVASTDNSDIPNIQSKSVYQVNDRSDISKTTSKDISLNNNPPSIQRTSELSQSSQDVSNQDYRQDIQYNTDTYSPANTALDNDVNSDIKEDSSNSIQRKLEISNSESANNSTNAFSRKNLDSGNRESQAGQSLDITNTINNNLPDSIQRDLALSTDTNPTNLEDLAGGQPKQINVDDNISNQTSQVNLLDSTNQTSNQILEPNAKSVSNNKQIENPTIQRSLDGLSGINIPIVTSTGDQNIDLPNTNINNPNVDSSERQLQRQSDEISDATITSQTTSQSLQDALDQSNLNSSSILNADTKTQNNYSNPDSSNISTSINSSLINNIPTQIQAKSDLEDIPNHSSSPSDVPSDRMLEVLPIREMSFPDINTDIIPNESPQSSIIPSNSESHTIQKSINNQEILTNNEISSSSFNEQLSQNNSVNESSRLIQRESDLDSTKSTISDNNISNTSIEQLQRSNSSLDIASNSNLPTISNSETSLDIQSKTNESNQDIFDYQDEQFSSNTVLQSNTSSSIEDIINRNIFQENISIPNSDINTEITSNAPINNLLSRKFDIGSDISTNDRKSYIEDINEINSTKTDSTEDDFSNTLQSNPDINNLDNNFNNDFISNIQNNIQRDSSDISNLEDIETKSIQRDAEILTSNNINAYESFVPVKDIGSFDTSINTQIDSITDSNIDQSSNLDSISTIDNQNVQRQADNAYNFNKTLTANIQNDIQRDISNTSNLENIESNQIQGNLISTNVDLDNTNEQSNSIIQDITSDSPQIYGNILHNDNDANSFSNLDSEAEKSNDLNDAFDIDNQNIQRQSDSINVNNLEVPSTGISDELSIQRNLLNESLPNTSSNLSDTSISNNNNNNNIQLEASPDSISISESRNASDTSIANPIDSSISTNTPSRDDIVAPSDRLNNQLQRQIELSDVGTANLSTDIEETDPLGMTFGAPDDLLQSSRQVSPDVSMADKLDTSNTDSNYPNLQTQIDTSSLNLSPILDSDLSSVPEDINSNIIQSDSITLATENIINRKVDQLDAINNNNDISTTNNKERSVQRENHLDVNEDINSSNVNAEWRDNSFEQVNESLTIQSKLDIVPSDSYLDRDLPSLQDPNVVESTQNNSLQEISQNSLDNISSEQIQRSYETTSIPSSEIVESDSSLQSSSESSLLNEYNLSPTNSELSDSYVENNTNTNSNATIALENNLGNREQNIQRKSESGDPSQNTNISNLDASFSTNNVSSLESDDAIQRQIDLDNGRTDIDANNAYSDRNLDVQDAINLFGVNDRGAAVPDLPIAQTSSSQPLQRKSDSGIDFNEIGSINTKDVDLSSSFNIENISADIDRNTQNIQRDYDISTNTSINKIDRTENIEKTSKYPSVTSSQNLVQTSDTSLINRKLDSIDQSVASQDLQQVSTDNIIDNALQSNSIQSHNLNVQQSSASNSPNTSIKFAEQTLDHSLNASSQVLPLNSVEDDEVVQTQRSLQENNAVVDPTNTSPDVSQTIQPKLDVAASDSYLDRDLTNLQDAEHYNIDETPQSITETSQSNSLGGISQNSLDNISSEQIQRSYEASSTPSNEVVKSTSNLQSSSESSLLNEYNLSHTNSEVSDIYVENSTNSNSNTTLDSENRTTSVQRKYDANNFSHNTNVSNLDASLSTNDVSGLELDNAIQRQVDLDNSRTDIDIASNTDSDRKIDVQDAIDSFSMNDRIVDNPDLPHKITEPSQTLQRAVDITQTVNAEFKGDTQEDLVDNSNSNEVFDTSSRETTQKDITASENLIQTSDTSLLNRKLDSSNQNLESQDLQSIARIDSSETILNDVNSQTENTLQNPSPIADKHSQDIQSSNISDSQNIDANSQALTNDISADNNSQTIQAKLDIPSPDLALDGNIDNNLERSDDNNLSNISNDDLVQKSPSSSKVNLEESSIDTNVVDTHPVNLQLSSQDNIQTLDGIDPSNVSSQSIDVSSQEIETIDKSTGLNAIQKDEIDANSQLIQRKSESIPLENLGNTVQSKTANAIASSKDQSNQTVIQRLSDQANADDLTLPTVLQNLGQTESLSNFTPLTNNQFNNQNSAQFTSTHPSQLLQAKSNGSTFGNAVSNSGSNSNSINALSPTPTRIQPKDDPTNQGSSPQETHAGWSNIAELLANLPPPKVSSNPSTSSLNKKLVSSGDRSSLASNPKPSLSASSQTTSSQAIIQRSLDANADDGDLYITPTGLQRGNPNQFTNSQSNTIQRQQMPSADANLPEATVKVNSRDDSDNDANFEENLNALAQEIYVLLRQRLEIEKERQGSRYQGRLPW
ncbi:hypothetical protein [Pseudanabaena yagii]|uniref:Uncharacterized protein n=1 Tax=Pseudanabaena yagii GIHE-NHR1 TaxID=2722753 RepID=A0ABX1LY92_9CYAN|nr:hypothetical protein [Pseudanabaena yagii]NMF59694.1 hypothetical protein [Pseudanabaena yagii GIHE-NHR1]